MKKWLQEYFRLSNREWNGLIVLIGLLLVIQGYLTYQFYNVPKLDLEIIQVADSLFRQNDEEFSESIREREYFYPNHPSEEELNSHQLSGYLIKNWMNYLKKGGKFKSLEDVRKLYGMNDSIYAYILPYMMEEKTPRENKSAVSKPYPFRTDTARLDDYKQLHIPFWLSERMYKYGERIGGFRSVDELFKVYGFDSTHLPKVVPYLIFKEESSPNFTPKAELVNLNVADSAALTTVRGIGPTFASRIIKYRSKLGGYVFLEQLLEVYGINQEQYDKIAPQLAITDTLVTKINVNTADFATLIRHPYISKELTQHILNFREDIRDFRSVEEVFQLGLMTDAEFHKLAPYLVVD